MVYGVLRLINFAHGDVMMVSTYLAFFSITGFSLLGFVIPQMPWYVSFPITIVLTSVLGFLIERLAYRPLRGAPRISALMTAIGVSFFLENLSLVIFGGRPKGFPTPDAFAGVFNVKDVALPSLSLWAPVIALIFLGATFYLV